MWDRIWHLRGAIPIADAVSDEVAVKRIVSFLSAHRKPVVQQDKSNVSFKYASWDEPIFKTGAAFVMSAITVHDEGRFWIERRPEGRTLRYDLGSYHGLILSLFGAAMFFLFGFVGSLSGGDFWIAFWLAVKLAVFAFAWGYGGNMLWARLSVPRALRKLLVAG